MVFNKANLWYHLRTTALAALIGFPTAFFFCDNCWDDPELMLKVGVFMSIIWIVMWKGNEAVSNICDRNVKWLEEPAKRLIIGTIGHLVYTVAAILLLNYIVYLLFGWNRGIVTLEGMIQYSIPAVAITFVISMFSTARVFFLSWRQLAINQEKMRAEIISSKFESLKNQVNPHFLFNSLNVLTSLVYKDPDLSAAFIKRLSNVYRYVLDVQNKEIVNLDDELKFLNSFAYLLQIRHQDGLQIDIDLPKDTKFKVAPLALQMLVENAVKHNIISKEEPLTIQIQMEDGYLLVRNNLQRKEVKEERTSSLGLTNIRSRYEFLSDKPVQVVENENEFLVKLPLVSLA